MLRNVLFAFLMMFTVVSSSAFAGSVVCPRTHVGDDRWVPWPWNLAQPFPWEDIEGLWKVDDGEFVTYFSFKVVREKETGIRQLQVKQFDRRACRQIAAGVGVEQNQQILAQMTARGEIIYRVQLTAFSTADAPLPPLRGNVPTQDVMVLSMGSLDQTGIEDMVHVQIAKVSRDLSHRSCIEDIKKIK